MFSNVILFGSKILYIFLLTMRIKDHNLLLNIEIDSEFFMLSTKLNQPFRAWPTQYTAIFLSY